MAFILSRQLRYPALYARTGRASWQGPMLGSFEEPDPFMLERFTAVFGRALEPLAFAEPEWASDWKREAGEAEGVLWGGNLALLASLAGTPWMPDVRGGILYLEDVGEAAYARYTIPPAIYVNLKITKRTGKFLDISLFVNKLFDYTPDFMRNGVLIRRNVSPYFGMEMTLKI